MVIEEKLEDYHNSTWTHECLQNFIQYFTRTKRELCGGGVSQGITKVIQILPLETMNVCAEFHSNPLSSCWDI